MVDILDIGIEWFYQFWISMSFRCLPSSFGLIWHGFGEGVVRRISRWLPWRPSWILERNNFSNSESLCYCNASHQVLAQSDLRFVRICRLKNFKMPSWTSKRKYFSNSESLCHCDASHQFSAQSVLWFGRRCHLKIAILNPHVATIPPIKFQLNPTYGSGGECEKLMTDGRTDDGQQTMTLADLEQRSANKTNISTFGLTYFRLFYLFFFFHFYWPQI